MLKTKSMEQEKTSMGFKDKQKALDTLTLLDGRDINYQYHVITSFVNRIKRTLQITKDEEKLTNLREALKIFEEWLRDYKLKNRGRENLAYLPIETIKAFRGLAKKYNVWEDTFYSTYKHNRGDYKNLRTAKIPSGDITWDIERNRRLKNIIDEMRNKHIQWYETDTGDFRGLPTKEHLRCIVLAYSPDPTKLKKLAVQVCKKFDDDGDDVDIEEKLKNKGTKRALDSSSNSDDDKSERKSAKQSKQSETKTENILSFKDKENALQSIKSLEGRDISYQYHAINGLVKRAERVISCTKNEQKIKNMREAVQIFENWITDYNVNSRSKENFDYLEIEIIQAFKQLAERYSIENSGFLRAYKEVNGDYKKLRFVKVPESDITWDVKRNKNLQELVHHIKENNIQWYDTNAEFSSLLPTVEHIRCIMWAFSPDVAKLKKLVPHLSDV